jgi:molybdate transport repressor ModE-like protein
MQTIEDLNDLRLIAAIAQAGSLAGAARHLGVNHATVFRRIMAVESRIGVRLFERQHGSYMPTPAGEELARTGAAMEEAALAAWMKVAGQDTRPSGIVRITTTDSIARSLLPAMLRSCRLRYPEIQLEVVLSGEMYDLSKRDADIAIRPSVKPPDHLIGKRIGKLGFAVYGENGYLKSKGEADWRSHDWITLDGTQSHHRVLKWLASIQPLDQIGVVFNTFAGVAAACINGLGLAVLPCFMGDVESELVRVADVPENCSSQLWLLTHPDLHRTARVKAVFHLLQEELAAKAALLAGHG